MCFYLNKNPLRNRLTKTSNYPYIIYSFFSVLLRVFSNFFNYFTKKLNFFIEHILVGQLTASFRTPPQHSMQFLIIASTKSSFFLIEDSFSNFS
nr:MAG TPA: hypothetical protein [Caudoviricetes sp.]